MKLTEKEEKVVEALGQLEVATAEVIEKKSGVGRNTVFRGLRKYGHYSSFNLGARYQTLRETPRFGPEGLWFFGDAGFSCHGRLPQTIKAVIEGSSEGRTLEELEGKLRTRVHNQLSQLIRSKEIEMFKAGRRAVYVSMDEKRGFEQQRRREEKRGKSVQASVIWGQGKAFLPECVDGFTVVRLLVEMIERPEASVASLSKKLQSSGFSIHAEEIREVMDFYGVKKTERSKSP